MTNVHSEAKFLSKAYRTFISAHLNEMHENETAHIHPPPAFTALYNMVLNDMASVAENGEELSKVEMVMALDIVLRFSIYLQKHQVDYTTFSPCECVVVDDDELNNILKAGN